MSYTVKRTQYPFDTTNIRCKSLKDILVMQRQWNTFERVENYNDIIFQRIQAGFRDAIYYQFIDHGELQDYNNGQQLHRLKFPSLPCSTFDSISSNDISPYPVLVPPPVMEVPAKCIQFSTAMTESEKTGRGSDMAIYTHVSSYNSAHTYKYVFVSDAERLAYHRAERIVLTS